MSGGETRLVAYNLTESANLSGEITGRVDRFYTQYDVPLSDWRGPYSASIRVHPLQANEWNELVYLPESVVDQARFLGEYALVLKTTFTGKLAPGAEFEAQASLLILLPPDAFSKDAPVNGAVVQPVNQSLQWNSSVGAIDYEYCFDTVDNNSCDTDWTGTYWLGTYDTNAALQNLPAGTTFYWQVRANNMAGTTYANNGSWWSFTTASISTPTTTPTSTPTHTPTPTSTPPYSYNPLYLSLTSSQTIDGVASADEDILYFDGTNWSLFFDGSDVGVGTPDLFAFSIVDSDTILMSFGTNVTVNGIAATPQDILRFDATSLGSTTTGTFSLHFDGSDVGLSDATNEKIDALSVTPDERLLISTTGNPSVPGVSGASDEDVLLFTPTTLGDATGGSWSLYFDGSDVGLGETSGEDVDALDVMAGNAYLSTADNFSVLGLLGADEDVFVCELFSTGETTTCTYQASLYFDGSTWGLDANDVDAFHFPATGLVPTAVPTNTPTATATPSQTPTNTATATATSTGGNTFTFIPLADAYVNAGNPTSNYGSSTALRADASPDVHSYLRFNVQGLSGSVTQATLRVYANSSSSLGCIASSVNDNTWSEATLNYNNAPPVGGGLDSSGLFGANVWVDLDVTAYITGNGTYSLALTTTSSTAMSLASRESGANAPQLIIETTP
jgi:hypothetical protein